jgi:protein SCO1
MAGNSKNGTKSERSRGLNGPAVMLAVVVLVGVGFLAARSYFGTAPTAGYSTSSGQAAIGGPFTLLDQDGQTVTDQDFHGQWMLIYFGFTYCPDVCPTSLARNAEALDMLGSGGDKVVPVLISVDPQRDTPEKMKDYVRYFHPRTVGLTGTPEQIAAVAKAYRVFYMKVEREDPDAYLVDHSSFTYLVGPDGRFVQFFRHEISAQDMADGLTKALGTTG